MIDYQALPPDVLSKITLEVIREVDEKRGCSLVDSSTVHRIH